MATAIAALISKVEAVAKGVYSQEWSATVSGVGNPLHAAYVDWVTLQLHGPTGGASKIIVEGTNGQTVSTATWTTLDSASGAAIDYANVTGGLVLSLRDLPLMVRPNFDTVTAGKTLTVKMIARGPLR